VLPELMQTGPKKKKKKKKMNVGKDRQTDMTKLRVTPVILRMHLKTNDLQGLLFLQL
jgi:hypothetical protein